MPCLLELLRLDLKTTFGMSLLFWSTRILKVGSDVIPVVCVVSELMRSLIKSCWKLNNVTQMIVKSGVKAGLGVN